MDDSGVDPPRRLTVSSDDLARDADEGAHRRYWEETVYGHALDMDFRGPSSWRLDVAGFGPVAFDRLRANIVRGARTPQRIAADGRDAFFIGMNRGGPALVSQRGRERG